MESPPAVRPDDVYVQTRLAAWAGSRRLTLLAPHSTFSASRIDDGTRLLLAHLPSGEPRTWLDLGCGYGALGLAVAARFPASRGVLVDRDLLAAHFCRRNARAEGLEGLVVRPGLGYLGLPPEPETFDWVLANVPARVGDRTTEHFLRGGVARLSRGGVLRLVIISPLASMAAEAAARAGLRCVEVARSGSHAVLSVAPGAGAPPPRDDPGTSVYLRDRVRVALPEALDLARPTDLADEPHRLESAIPLLAGALPPGEPRSVLVFRCGYGLVPAVVLARYPGTRVLALDRDLLATAFTTENGAAWPGRLAVEASVDLLPAFARGPFELVLGELSPPLGLAPALRELAQARRVLAPGGRALVVGLRKEWRALERRGLDRGWSPRGTRGPVAVYETTR